MIVTPIFKAGAATDMANYRPITLLNTDYRLLAKILAKRLGPALGDAIGPEQGAFLPGRRITDNTTLLHLLPAALKAQGKNDDAALVEARFKKAWARADVTLTASRFGRRE